MNHLVSIDDWSADEILSVLELADGLKARPADYADVMHRKVLLMIFEKPSLRTRISFETGMSQMGGHAIYYDLSTSPLSAGKETVSDMAKVAGRMVDMIMARVFDHTTIEEMATYSGVPVINALSDLAHPCQLFSDLQTVREKKGPLEGLKIAYFGDAENNVTYSLMAGCAKMGMRVHVACPPTEGFSPRPERLAASQAFAADAGGEVVVTSDPTEAARDADVIYTDSWMSYHIPKEKQDERVAALRPYQVDAAVMAHAKPEAIFMNCLPAARGYEQTAEVIDGLQSVVFDQAENRLHAQKAIMIRLLEA